MLFAYEKTKAQISCAETSSYVFCYIVQSHYILNLKFQASSKLSSVAVKPGMCRLVRNSKDRFFHDAAQIVF